MPFWIYEPKKLLSSSLLIPYKQKDFGDFLNFLTLFSLFTYMYLYKTKQIEKYSKILLLYSITIFFIGLISGLKSQDNYNDNNAFGNYENALIIE